MKITFLGTGTSQGVPVIACECDICRSPDPRDKRLRSSVWLKDDDHSIVIDTGPDFRQQMLRNAVMQLNAVLFTHEHRDHIAGLDDIRSFNFRQREAMDVFCEDRVARALKREFPYIFAEHKYPGVPQVRLNLVSNEPFFINNWKIIPVRAMHLRLPVLGFRIGDFAYITDANYITEDEKEKLFGVKYLVLNALRKEKHISHFNLEEALQLAMEISPRKTFLTHIGHQMGFQSDLEKELPDSVMLAWDGLSLDTVSGLIKGPDEQNHR